MLVLKRCYFLIFYVPYDVPNFATYENVLRNLVVCDAKHITWNVIAIKAFESLKYEIGKQNVLAHFIESYETEIFCDASGSCLGAVLTQIQPDGESRVVQYAFRTLNAVKQRYSNTERELLAIVWVVIKKFRSYTKYKSFLVYKDHKAPIGKTKLTEDSKRTVRLWLKLAEFNIAIKHRAGAEMAATDALSRHVACAAITDVHTTEIMECHDEFEHRSWKATNEVLKLSRSWKGMQQEIWGVVRVAVTAYDIISGNQKEAKG
jgi:RNase H-like domain found in reverse transcriptase